jgi:hypothetical protein
MRLVNTTQFLVWGLKRDGFHEVASGRTESGEIAGIDLGRENRGAANWESQRFRRAEGEPRKKHR